MGENSKRSYEVDVILCTCNLLKYNKIAVESLYKNTTIPFHLIVIDVNSTDGTKEWLKDLVAEKGDVTLHLLEEKDKGFADGFNRGLKSCKTPFAASYHPDMICPKTRWLEHIMPLFQDKKVAYVGAKLLYPNEQIQHAGATFNSDFQWYHIGRHAFHNTYMKTWEVAGVTGAGSVLRIEAVPNGIPDFYERAEYSDVELSVQLRHDGWKILQCNQAVLYHWETLSGKLGNIDWSELGKRYRRHYLQFKSRWEKWLIEDIKKNPHLYNLPGS